MTDQHSTAPALVNDYFVDATNGNKVTMKRWANDQTMQLQIVFPDNEMIMKGSPEVFNPASLAIHLTQAETFQVIAALMEICDPNLICTFMEDIQKAERTSFAAGFEAGSREASQGGTPATNLVNDEVDLLSAGVSSLTLAGTVETTVGQLGLCGPIGTEAACAPGCCEGK